MLRDELRTAVEYWGAAIAVVLLMVAFVWLLRRIVKAQGTVAQYTERKAKRK